MTSGLESGTVVAITDLFFSISVVLLISIALSEPDVPIRVTIQADLFVLCPTADGMRHLQVMPAVPVTMTDGLIESFDTSEAIPVPTKEALAEAMGAFSERLAGRPLVTAALVNALPHAVTADCLRVAKAEVFGAYNVWISELSEKPGLPPVGLTMSPVGLAPGVEALADAGN